ncbi:hypothetical protein SAMN04487928_1291 [Butyrivibrio proteoclasticus]|uniref:Uncharacterized protein n=1 Tax=Butyrivibrio proteoclasticus TaxID=43305 RepID=A0A1I5X757_9FIRM|nr:Bsp6I family type II restriction endonuclease [Butyrivibrio proteoclasticus]SFQ27829.1 hypothetical protein SAMN04487928_1291 [Butyrivibrio proteoclasticus]
MNKNNVLDKKEIEYLQTLVRLDGLHKEMFGKKRNINLPVKFTERICRKLLGLSEYKGKAYDAKDKNGGCTIEIKATCMPNPRTTFSREHEADKYIWLKLVAEDNCIEIIELDKKEVEVAVHKDKTKRTRASVDLDNINGQNMLIRFNYINMTFEGDDN